MATSNVEVIEIGVPGPPGAGVSAAEKATFVTLSAANVFTQLQTIDKDGQAFRVRSGDGATNKLDVHTTQFTNGVLRGYNALDIVLYSDNAVTQTIYLDGGAGTANFAGAIAVSRIVGDTVHWGFPIDGGGSAITTGVKIYGYPVPYNCLVTAWEIIADQTGSIVVDIWQDTYANYAPTVGDTITTSEKPTLSAASKNTDTSLNSGNGWALTGGRWLRFNVESVSTVTWVCIKLTVVRT